MVWVCLFASLPLQGQEHPLISSMADQFKALHNYTTLLDSEGKEGRSQMVYTYQKPGYVRMDFIHPHRGARLIFNPMENQVTLWPFSVKFISIHLSPDNPLITDPKGHTVEKSDIGSLIDSVRKCAMEGSVTLLPPEQIETLLCPRILITSPLESYLLWINPKLSLPVKVVKGLKGDKQETVFLGNLSVDVPLDDSFFNP